MRQSPLEKDGEKAREWIIRYEEGSRERDGSILIDTWNTLVIVRVICLSVLYMRCHDIRCHCSYKTPSPGKFKAQGG